MLEITKVIQWDMGHRIPQHKSQCKHPHGHRYVLEATLTGPLEDTEGHGEEGMVYDFGDFKKLMMEAVHDPLDHSFMFHHKDPIMADFFGKNPELQAVQVPFIPTAENIVRWCYERIQALLPKELQLKSCRLYETPNSWADYRG